MWRPRICGALSSVSGHTVHVGLKRRKLSRQCWWKAGMFSMPEFQYMKSVLP